MLVTFIATLAALASLTNAAPAEIFQELHERRDSLGDWVKYERLHADEILPMRVGLTQSNLDKGYDLLMDVYVSWTGARLMSSVFIIHADS